MLEVTLTVTLDLKGPVLSQATAMGKLGVDAHMACDHQGSYYLPFSLVRGRLRQAWEEINEVASPEHVQGVPPLDQLLGPRVDAPESRETSDYHPRRGRLRLTDFKYVGEPVFPETLYRIRMDAARGSVDEGAMQIIESPFAPGRQVTFRGDICFRARSREEADAIQTYIHKGLRWIPNLGAERTSGFGRLTGVTLVAKYDSMTPRASENIPEAPEMFQIAIRPQAPFCVSKRQITPNVFESEIVLSGGVLRGTLATMLKDAAGLARNDIIAETTEGPWQELRSHFNAIRFTHAFPAPQSATARPVVAPLSLVKDPDGHLLEDAQGQVCDVSLCDAPGLIGASRRAPSFAVDWKSSRDVDALFGWPAAEQIERDLRVRTEIDRDYRRAKDERLFAYDMVVPDGLTWYGTVDLRRVPAGHDRDAVAAQLRDFLQVGLRGLGKTKVSTTVDTNATFEAKQPSQPTPIDNDLWVVTLQTPALLCDPKKLDETSGQDALFDNYAAAWADMSQQKLQLVRFFASQILTGGYQVYRFQPNKPYYPFLLTAPGSVFVLRAEADVSTAQTVIEDWLAQGLSLPGWAVAAYGENWQTCPFLREDGFGEIVVNLPCNRRPDTEVFHAI